MSRPPVHGLSNTPTYKSWRGMLDRCHPKRGKYTPMGIVVCEAWKSSFVIFLADMGFRPSLSHTIDRIDNNGNYEPGNCRWATKIEQGNNQRTNRHVLYLGTKMTISEARRISGQNVPKTTVLERLGRGWSVEKALETKPIMGRNQWKRTDAETLGF